jgi:hypothetical protein
MAGVFGVSSSVHYKWVKQEVSKKRSQRDAELVRLIREDHCREQCAGLEEAVLIEDTSEMNLESHRKRIKDRRGGGQWGTGKTWDFSAIRRWLQSP